MMGYSQTVASANVSDRWTRACVQSSGMQNVWTDRGQWYMWERGREQDDGAEVGSIMRFVGHPYIPTAIPTRQCVQCGERDHTASAYRTGSYRIDPDGRVARAPAFLRRAV